jgi:hypothetical protein
MLRFYREPLAKSLLRFAAAGQFAGKSILNSCPKAAKYSYQGDTHSHRQALGAT